MRRREFIAGIGSAAAWPVVVRAQQGERVRRVGVLVPGAEDQAYQARIDAFRDGLAKLGWIEDRNLRIDVRFGGNDASRIRAYAIELASLAPDAVVTQSGLVTREMQQQSRTIPIVITGAGDVANGLVQNIARPEGNTTGITNLFWSIGGKWLELLKQAAPNLERVGYIYNARVVGSLGSENCCYYASIEEAAGKLAVKTINIPYRDTADIAAAIAAFAAEPNGGLIVSPPPPRAANREAIVRLAALRQLPAIYQDRSFVAEGGLIAYGSDIVNNFRRASYFVDRILRGAKVSELPIEYPTKFETVINLKTAKALGLTIPETLLATADEVIE
jgi:putative tryptophan/tyrosine transport system substrate-binding protein